MELNQFEYIVAIAEEGSVSKAAKRLYISQSALSQYLLKIEKSLGVPLFKRIDRRMVLTYEGECFIKAAKEILQINDNFSKLLIDISNSKKGRFSIGLTPGRGLEMFSSIYPKFQAQYPKVKMDVLEIQGSVLLEQAMAQGKIDIATVSTKTLEEKLHYEFLCSEELVLILRCDHKYAYLDYNTSGKKLHVEDLNLFKDDEFILASKATTLRSKIDDILRQARFTPNVTFVLSSFPTHVKLVQAGVGICFSYRQYTKNMKGLVEIRLQPEAVRCLWAAYRKGAYLSRAELYFIDLIKEYHSDMDRIYSE